MLNKMFRKKENIKNKDFEIPLEELLAGSAEAFKILYEKYSSRIYRFCLKILGSETLARDAFQETFVRVYEHRKSFTGNNFSGWLFTIARNTCINIIRRKKHHVNFDEVNFQNDLNQPRDLLLKEIIDDAISKLPLKLREAIILREYEDYTYNEIAEILGVDLSLAKVRVFRARKLLKEMLKPIVKELNEYR